MKSSRTSPDLFSRRGLLLLVAIAGALSACGGGGGGGSADSSGNPSNSATLSWDGVIDPNLGGYRIYYGTAPGAYQQPVGSGLYVGNVTSFTVTGLTSGTRYYFAATASDKSNNESAFSNEVFKDIH